MSFQRIAGWITKTIQVKPELNGKTTEHSVLSVWQKASFTCRTRLVSGRGRRKGIWQMRLSVLKKIRLFFIKNGLKISRLGDILLFRSGGSCNARPAVELLASVISAKLCENQPSFLSFFAPEIEMPAQEDCIFVSCWAFLCASREQVLGWTFTQCVWEASGFFVPGRCLVRRNDTLLPEVAMLLFDCPHSHQIHPVGDSFIRRLLSYFSDKSQKEVW